jgi:nitrogen fixation protein
MLNLIKDYRQHDALHYSKLAALSKGYGTYVNKKYWVDQFAMNHGNAFECLLTYPEHFDTMFYISNEDNYSRGSAKSVIKLVFDTLQSYVPLDTLKEPLLLSASQEGYGGSWTEDRIWNSLLKLEVFYEDLWKAKGKTIISRVDYERIQHQVEMVKNHPFTSHIVKSWTGFQVPNYFSYNGIEGKRLYDAVSETGLYDIKYTNGSVKDFNFSLRKFRYDIQAAWYSYHQDFPLQFLVVSHVTNEPPLLYTLSLKDLTVAFDGISKGTNNEFIEDMRVPGIKQIINNYNWHLSNPDVDVDRGIFITNGRLITNAYDTIYYSNPVD